MRPAAAAASELLHPAPPCVDRVQRREQQCRIGFKAPLLLFLSPLLLLPRRLDSTGLGPPSRPRP
jgi:hypothetical protein